MGEEQSVEGYVRIWLWCDRGNRDERMCMMVHDDAGDEIRGSKDRRLVSSQFV